MEKQESKDRFPTFPQPRRLRSTFSYGIRILGARSKESCMDPPIHPEIEPHTQIPGRTSGFIVLERINRVVLLKLLSYSGGRTWSGGSELVRALRSFCMAGGAGTEKRGGGDPEKKQVDLP